MSYYPKIDLGEGVKKFKEGDWVIATWEKRIGMDIVNYIGKVQKIVHNGMSIDIGHPDTRFAPSMLEKLTVSNKLNKRLYPNYEEYNGYLIPPEAADKLNGVKK